MVIKVRLGFRQAFPSLTLWDQAACESRWQGSASDVPDQVVGDYRWDASGTGAFDGAAQWWSGWAS